MITLAKERQIASPEWPPARCPPIIEYAEHIFCCVSARGGNWPRINVHRLLSCQCLAKPILRAAARKITDARRNLDHAVTRPIGMRARKNIATEREREGHGGQCASIGPPSSHRSTPVGPTARSMSTSGPPSRYTQLHHNPAIETDGVGQRVQ